MTQKRLTYSKIIKENQQGMYSDGDGLYLKISAAGSRSFVLRTFIGTVAQDLTLGKFPEMSLTQARKIARLEKQKLKEGASSKTVRQAPKKVETTNKKRQPTPTFKWCADEYINAHKSAWSEKHCAGWSQSLRDYAYPHFGDKYVNAISRQDVIDAISPIWQTRTETATRVLSRIRIVLSWAKASGHRNGDNPAAWKDNISFSLPDRNKVAPTIHHEALPFKEIPEFMQKLLKYDDAISRALAFTILTATRSSESRYAEWSEINMEGAEWIIPAARMKARKEHRVPISSGVMDLFGSYENEKSGLIFKSSRNGKKNGEAISGMSFCRRLKEMGYSITTHGFRSTFRDWAAETTDYPNEVVEMALAHAIGSKVEAAYRRGNLLEKRRRLMDDWASHCLKNIIDNHTVNEVITSR